VWIDPVDPVAGITARVLPKLETTADRLDFASSSEEGRVSINRRGSRSPARLPRRGSRSLDLSLCHVQFRMSSFVVVLVNHAAHEIAERWPGVFGIAVDPGSNSLTSRPPPACSVDGGCSSTRFALVVA
jgi:hypothetical protein